MVAIKIFVEGIADVTFLKDYISHIAPDFEITKETVIDTGGWTHINSQKEKGESIQNQMKQNTDNDGINLVIFDADKDFEHRRQEIDNWKSKYGLTFKLFLFPDNQSIGALEDLLENIIIDTNKPILDCWNGFEVCIQKCVREKIARKLTIPAKKTKIYAYLEVLLGETKKEKEKIKERKRDYKNGYHWNLDAGYLDSLKIFLVENLYPVDQKEIIAAGGFGRDNMEGIR